MAEKFITKKSLGQHFLNNDRVPKAMADAAEIQKGETIFEIGPGTGVLTRELLDCGAHVVAVETDARAIESLKITFENEVRDKTLTLFERNMRTTTPKELGLRDGAYKAVSNIPYYLSGRLFRLLLESDCQPSCIVFLVQKEVAERIARDTKESLLSLSVKAFGEPHYVKTVKRGNFNPPPKVDSAIVLISHISRDRFKDLDMNFFFELLHLGFASKRKQLLGNLATVFERELLTHTFSTVGINQNARGEDLTLEKWLLLAKALEMHR